MEDIPKYIFVTHSKPGSGGYSRVEAQNIMELQFFIVPDGHLNMKDAFWQENGWNWGFNQGPKRATSGIYLTFAFSM